MPAATGTPELDTLSNALAMTSRRLAELVAREREFSANASHQLRTPLAGLQVSLARGDLVAASAEADRLSATVDHMLALARNALPTAEVIDIAPIIDAVVRRWRTAYSDAGRELVTTVSGELPGIRARTGSIEQAVDVLLDNALRHGGGQTRITARPAAGGLVVQIDDDGSGIDTERASTIFDRHEGVSTGIGLPLARTLIDADGGRLVLSEPDHAEFRIVFAGARDSS